MKPLALALALAAALAGCSKQPDPEAGPGGNPPPAAADPEGAGSKQAAEDRLKEMRAEEDVREEAPWFGQTGLDEETERELPRYLRRELGQSLFKPGSLKAADLAYVGLFTEGAEVVRYWRMPPVDGKAVHAYIAQSGATGGPRLGWGNRNPPAK